VPDWQTRMFKTVPSDRINCTLQNYWCYFMTRSTSVLKVSRVKFLNKTSSASLYFWCACLTTLSLGDRGFSLPQAPGFSARPRDERNLWHPAQQRTMLIFLICDWGMFYRRVQVVTEYSLVHVSHSTLQHHTNLQRHLTFFVCRTVLCPRPHELQSDLHLLVATSSLLHDLPSKPSEPAVLFRTQ